MQTKLLSVIIPYYKETPAELFLALASISGQLGVDFERIECVLVNDGSGNVLTDEFLALFNPLSVRCIYLTENRGPGVARQAGIDGTQGEYVMFCDADDALHHVWVLRTFLAAIEKNHPDLIYTPVIMEFYSPASRTYVYGLKDDRFDILHGKVYRRACLDDKKVRFHENLRLYEDAFFNELALAASQKTQKIAETAYIRKYRADSLTHADSFDHFIRSLPESIRCVDYLCEEFLTRYPEKLPVLLAQNIAYYYFTMHWSQWQEPEEQELIKKAERDLCDVIAPRMDYYKQVSEADLARIFNQKRLIFWSGGGEIESLPEWLERIQRCQDER